MALTISTVVDLPSSGAVLVAAGAFYAPTAFGIGTYGHIHTQSLIEMSIGVAIGAISFLALEAIGGTIALSYGFSNALWAILVVGLITFLTGLPISYYAAKYGVDMDLLTRGAGGEHCRQGWCYAKPAKRLDRRPKVFPGIPRVHSARVKRGPEGAQFVCSGVLFHSLFPCWASCIDPAGVPRLETPLCHLIMSFSL